MLFFYLLDFFLKPQEDERNPECLEYTPPPEMDFDEDWWSGVKWGFWLPEKKHVVFFLWKNKGTARNLLGLDLGVFCPCFFGRGTWKNPSNQSKFLAFSRIVRLFLVSCPFGGKRTFPSNFPREPKVRLPPINSRAGLIKGLWKPIDFPGRFPWKLFVTLRFPLGSHWSSGCYGRFLFLGFSQRGWPGWRLRLTWVKGGWSKDLSNEKRAYPGCLGCIGWVVPLPRLLVTTRIITFLVGNPYKPSFPLLLGRGTTQCIGGYSYTTLCYRV